MKYIIIPRNIFRFSNIVRKRQTFISLHIFPFKFFRVVLLRRPEAHSIAFATHRLQRMQIEELLKWKSFRIVMIEIREYSRNKDVIYIHIYILAQGHSLEFNTFGSVYFVYGSIKCFNNSLLKRPPSGCTQVSWLECYFFPAIPVTFMYMKFRRNITVVYLFIDLKVGAPYFGTIKCFQNIFF